MYNWISYHVLKFYVIFPHEFPPATEEFSILEWSTESCQLVSASDTETVCRCVVNKGFLGSFGGFVEVRVTFPASRCSTAVGYLNWVYMLLVKRLVDI